MACIQAGDHPKVRLKQLRQQLLPIMRPDEELVALIQSGTDVQKNMNQLYEQNLGTIIAVAGEFVRDGLDRNDLIQDAYFSLETAVKSHDPAKELPFNYIFRFILRRDFVMLRHEHKYARLAHVAKGELTYIMKFLRFQGTYQREHDGQLPTTTEYLKALRISEAKLKSIQETLRQGNYRSLSEQAGSLNEDTTLGDIVPDRTNFEDSIVEEMGQEWGKKVLWNAVDSLADQQQRKFIKMRYQSNMQVKEISKELSSPPKALYNAEQCAFKELSARKDVQEAAEIFGCNSSFGYKGSLRRFKEDGESCVEFLAIKHIELEERLSIIKQRMNSYAAQ